jgi:hypothetical protein
MWERVLAAVEGRGCVSGGSAGRGVHAATVREECDVLVETSEQVFANNAMRCLFRSGCTGEEEDGSGGGCALALAVTHGMSRVIGFLLSRAWPSANASLRGRMEGAARALTDAARPYCHCLVDAALLHLSALKREQLQLGGEGGEGGEENGGAKRKARKCKAGDDVKDVKEVATGAWGWRVGGSGEEARGGVEVTLAALWELHAHLTADKARAVVLAILELHLECKHTQALVDSYCEVAAGMSPLLPSSFLPSSPPPLLPYAFS